MGGGCRLYSVEQPGIAWYIAILGDSLKHVSKCAPIAVPSGSTTRRHYQFVTGRLAAPSLEVVVRDLSAKHGFDYTIDVMRISVAALMTPEWLARHISRVPLATHVMLPGYCGGDLTPVAAVAGKPVEKGPKDLRRLPEHFGGQRTLPAGYGQYDIEILAEINHAPRMELSDVLAMAGRYRANGADVIDIGCDPGHEWPKVGDAVKALRDEGHRVSIDSFNVREVEMAVRAGAELVLSVDSTNRESASDWGCEVVAIPDVPNRMVGLDSTIEYLQQQQVPFRVDPVLEPIGCGFSESLGRYLECRRRYAKLEMMMGVGNLTELTDADSAAINVLLLGICQEQGIRSILTTEVINWARSSVRECDLARRLVYHAVKNSQLPKHVEPRLILLRDASLVDIDLETLGRLADEIKDNNYRLFAGEGTLHAVTANQHHSDGNPFRLFEKMLNQSPRPLDASHAFYLGFELAKAVTALTLGKDYRQDESLDWGFLTRAEESHRGRGRSSTENPPPT